MGEFPIHAQKMILHRLSIKEYAKQLLSQGHNVELIERSGYTKTHEVFEYIYTQGITTIHVVDTVDQWLEKRIQKAQDLHGFERVSYESPMFLLSKQESIERYISSKRHKARFYKHMRIRT